MFAIWCLPIFLSKFKHSQLQRRRSLLTDIAAVVLLSDPITSGAVKLVLKPRRVARDRQYIRSPASEDRARLSLGFYASERYSSQTGENWPLKYHLHFQSLLKDEKLFFVQYITRVTLQRQTF